MRDGAGNEQKWLAGKSQQWGLVSRGEKEEGGKV